MALIDRIRETIGDESAAMLVKSFGGRKLYVPIKATEGHPIAQKIGLPPAAALSRRFGGEYMDVPNKSFSRRQILALAAKNVTDTEIARKLGCSRRWVSKVLQADDA